MNHPLICGVDPGASGGIAFLNANNAAVVDLFPMPLGKDGRVDARELASFFAGRHVLRAYVENVASRPRQAGQFAFGVSTGVVHGVLGACGVPFALVAPISWKGAYGLKREPDEKKREAKRKSLIAAQQLFPSSADRFARAKDDGVAEAALIALYGLNLFISE